MDELDLLKKDWNTKSNHNTISAKDIYPMLHRKSSSIVKTLFYISIIELLFWVCINTLPLVCSQSYKNKLDRIYTSDYLFTALTIISYAVILSFIYLLFKAHKAISITDSAKLLMENILKIRRIIKYYVAFNLSLFGISIVIGLIYNIKNDPNTSETLHAFSKNQMLVSGLVVLVLIAAIVLLVWLFYKLIYGILLKRLNENYNTLKNLEA
jgi:hypothetical protein